MTNSRDIWAAHYSERIDASRKYPAEWLVRTLKGTSYPRLKLDRAGYAGAKVLDLGCGDGRNLGLLQDLGFSVHATEISDRIVASLERIKPDMGWDVTFKRGLNTDLPYEDSFFDYVVSCWSFYYVPEGAGPRDILREIARVLRKGGSFIASIPDRDNCILRGAKRLDDGSMIIQNDPLGIRDGTRWMAADSPEELCGLLNPYFEDISIGHLSDDYFGLVLSGFIFVCRKKASPDRVG
jgi:SAM-dependent methyltransferase